MRIPFFQFGPLPVPMIGGVMPAYHAFNSATNMPLSPLPMASPGVYRDETPVELPKPPGVQLDLKCPDGGTWNKTAQMCIPKDPKFGDYAEAAYNTVDNELLRGGALFNFAGQSALGAANAPGWRPDAGLGAAGGFFTGAASGGILGGLIGAGAGFLQTAQNRTNYENLQELYNRQRIRNKTVGANYGYYAQFGGETQQQATPTQTEWGEVVLFPDNALPNVMARELHKHMDDDDITDMLPEGSYVFSNDKTMKFDVRDIREELLGLGMSYYNEQGNEGADEMEMGDVLPKRGKLTFAEAAKSIRQKIKTTGNRNDLMDIATDSDNLETRVPYLMKLVQMQDEKNIRAGRTADAQVPMYKWGGRIGKAQMGTYPMQRDHTYVQVNPYIAKNPFLTGEQEFYWGPVDPSASPDVKAWQAGVTPEDFFYDEYKQAKAFNDNWFANRKSPGYTQDIKNRHKKNLDRFYKNVPVFVGRSSGFDRRLNPGGYGLFQGDAPSINPNVYRSFNPLNTLFYFDDPTADNLSTITHEDAHRNHYSGLNSPDNKLKKFWEGEFKKIEDIISPIQRDTKIFPDEKFFNYLRTPEEVHARMMDARQFLMMDPKEQFKKEHYDRLMEAYKKKDDRGGWPELLNLIKDKNQFARLMNSVVQITPTEDKKVPIAQYGPLPKDPFAWPAEFESNIPRNQGKYWNDPWGAGGPFFLPNGTPLPRGRGFTTTDNGLLGPKRVSPQAIDRTPLRWREDLPDVAATARDNTAVTKNPYIAKNPLLTGDWKFNWNPPYDLSTELGRQQKKSEAERERAFVDVFDQALGYNDNWFKNRRIPGYDKNISDQLLASRDYYFGRPSVTVGTSGKGTKAQFQSNVEQLDTIRHNVRDSGEFSFRSDLPSVGDIVHEDAHRYQHSGLYSAFPELRAFWEDQFKKISDIVDPIPNPADKNSIDAYNYYNYLKQPNEVHSRIMDARQYLMLDPKEKFKDEHYKRLIEGFNKSANPDDEGSWERLLKFINNKDTFKRLMNSVVSINPSQYMPPTERPPQLPGETPMAQHGTLPTTAKRWNDGTYRWNLNQGPIPLNPNDPLYSSSHLMGYHNNMAFPYLFPKVYDPTGQSNWMIGHNPTDWIEYPFNGPGTGQAIDEAARRGELYRFNTVHEADKFSRGDYKIPKKQTGDTAFPFTRTWQVTDNGMMDTGFDHVGTTPLYEPYFIGDKKHPNFYTYQALQDEKTMDRMYDLFDKYGITDPMERAIIFNESKGDPTKESPSGYRGLYQIGPEVVKDWNDSTGKYFDPENMDTYFDAGNNQKLGSWYLHKRIPQMLPKGFRDASKYPSLIAAAYNMGAGNLRKFLKSHPQNPGEDNSAYVERLRPLFPEETQNYSTRLWMARKRFELPRDVTTRPKGMKKKKTGGWTIVD